MILALQNGVSWRGLPVDRRLEEEVQRRLRAIREDRERLMRYDINGDGVIDGVEWEEVRRVITAEVQTEWRREQRLHDDRGHHCDPRSLRHFEVFERIGRGGQGWTYRGRDKTTGQPVAIKELDLTGVDDWKAIELFEREATVLESLDHPAIPAYIDSFHLSGDDGRSERFFLVQEFVEGQDLASLLDEGLRFDEAQARAFLIEMLEILQYLHSLDPPVIHRDVKPSNIIRRHAGPLALIDFGAVQALLPDQGGASTIVGTSGYMPLEQLMGRTVPATDLYALAATAVHLLSHRHPADLPVDAMALQFREFVNISEESAALLENMLAPHIEDRLSTADEALSILRGEISLATPPTTPPRQVAVATIERPQRMHSTVEPHEKGIHIDVPPTRRSPAQTSAMVLIVLGVGLAMLFGGMGVVTGQGWYFATALILALPFLGGGLLKRRESSCAITITIDGDKAQIGRRWRRKNKSIELSTSDLGPLRIHRRGANNHHYSATYELVLNWRNQSEHLLSKVVLTSSLRFGGGLPTEEQRFIAEQYRNALIRHRSSRASPNT